VHEPLDLLCGRRLVVLTGAGVSTDSGIPDYRGPTGLQRSGGRSPMTYGEFVSGPAAQQRYWARSYLGWPTMRHAEPNPSHHALARLEAHGAVTLLVTQNVDGLHERAGSRSLCALHGRISDVVCLGCRAVSSRAALQRRMAVGNPGFAERHPDLAVRPDGDVDLEATVGFRVPACERCGGVLKPDVVFFGENVPRPRVQRCLDAVEAAEAVLVGGSSLTVLSGFRFVRHAHKLGIPVVVVNRGATRGDPLASHKVEAGCADFLTALERRAASTTPSAAGTSR
jgi:NAD-dependent SIR2 family protein deacetylase